MATPPAIVDQRGTSSSVVLQDTDGKDGINSTDEDFQVTKFHSYSLNINKNLATKLEACNRDDPVRIEHTGGGTRIFCQTGYFQILAQAIRFYVEKHPELEFSPDSRTEKDSRGCKVQEFLKIMSNGQYMCTLGIYNTQSSLLVNGKKCGIFLNKHCANIHKMIMNSTFSVTHGNNTLVDQKALNDMFRRSLSTWNKMVPSDENPQNQLAITTRQVDSQLGLNESDDDSTSDPKCPMCDKPAEEEAVECEECLSWYHRVCIKMTKTRYNELSDDTISTASFAEMKTSWHYWKKKKTIRYRITYLYHLPTRQMKEQMM